MNNLKMIKVIEVAPRDGWQILKDFIPIPTKIDCIERMLEAGISHIQAGSFVSTKLIPQMKNIEEVFYAIMDKFPSVTTTALVPNLFGAKAAVNCGLKEVNYVVSVSESHNKANTNRTINSSFEELSKIRESFPDLFITLDAATAFGCPFEGETPLDVLMSYLRTSVSLGINSINLCDTIGVAYPAQVQEYIKSIHSEFPQLPLGVHIHDTRNMGIVNTWAAIENNVNYVQTSLGGLGGCPFAPGASGNTSTEDLVYMLDKNGIATGIDFNKLLAAAKYMASLIKGNYSGHHINIQAN